MFKTKKYQVSFRKSLRAIIKWIRIILGVRPTVGDYVAGYSDYNIQYMGIIIKDNSNCSMLPTYRIRGAVVYVQEWTWKTIVEPDDDFIVLAGRIRYA